MQFDIRFIPSSIKPHYITVTLFICINYLMVLPSLHKYLCFPLLYFACVAYRLPESPNLKYLLVSLGDGRHTPPRLNSYTLPPPEIRVHYEEFPQPESKGKAEGTPSMDLAGKPMPHKDGFRRIKWEDSADTKPPKTPTPPPVVQATDPPPDSGAIRCNVNGMAGQGDKRGSCREYQICHAGGKCKPGCKLGGDVGTGLKRGNCGQGLSCQANGACLKINCPETCKKCSSGQPIQHTGGKDLNSDGHCEYSCSAPLKFGMRYCGEGALYTTGSFVDCSKCKKIVK